MSPVLDQPQPGKPYTIRDGDTVSNIAFRAFGDARRYLEVYEFNRTVIGPKPTHLAVGLVIEIPNTDYLPTPRSLFARGSVGKTFSPAPGGPASPEK
ncbi:MAG TPA: hypothetical protein VH165_07285 [Kofleriaceae bacterium]|jgi:hypothetical protein|nr:hypothetical protein [Kofleriaceae bacterium]